MTLTYSQGIFMSLGIKEKFQKLYLNKLRLYGFTYIVLFVLNSLHCEFVLKQVNN